MATAIIPIITGLAPALIELIAGLVHQFAPREEQQLGAGTGQAKMANVFSDVVQSLQKAAAVGTIPKELPPDQTIGLIIQSVVSSMKLSGLLEPPPTATLAPAQDITLRPGQSVRITVGS